MTIKIGDTIVSVTEEKDLRNYQGHRVLGLSCITKNGKKGYIKLLADLTLPEFWRYVSGETAGSICSVQKKIVMKILGLSREALETIIDTPEKAKKFLFLHEVSHILHEDSNNQRLSEVPHLHPYRIGIEARATWDAWVKIRNNNDNMAKYRVQRVFSEDGEQKSGMGTGTKIALGVGAIGAGLMAGRAGMLGTGIQKSIGTGTAKLGNMVGSQGLINDGAKTVGKAAQTNAAKSWGIDLTKNGAAAAKNQLGVTDAQTAFKDIASQRVNAKNEILNKYTLNPKSAPVQAAFSEDTNQGLREAALIAGGLTLTAGGVLAAKKGWLGERAKKAYEKVSKNLKENIKKPEAQKTGEAPKAVEVPKAGETVVNDAAKKIKKYSPEDWKKIKDAMKDPKNKGLSLDKVAEKLGIKPSQEWLNANPTK